MTAGHALVESATTAGAVKRPLKAQRIGKELDEHVRDGSLGSAIAGDATKPKERTGGPTRGSSRDVAEREPVGADAARRRHRPKRHPRTHAEGAPENGLRLTCKADQSRGGRRPRRD